MLILKEVTARMRLTAEESAMLNGEFGPATQKAMRILTSIGDIYGAERMARTEHVHVASGTVISTGTGGAQFIEWMAENGGRARCYATVNPSAIDSTHWKRLGIPREYYDWQLRLNRAYETMGIITAYSCTPYLVGNVPHFGELMCSAESSAIPMYNGYFGARTNRQGNPSSLSSALTGRVPVYGLLLDENRFGNMVIDVRIPCRSDHDWATLGYFIGKHAVSRIPVLVGIEDGVSLDHCKMMRAGMNSSGAVPHFHIVGITPEAPTLDAALGGKKPLETCVYDKAARREMERHLCNASGEAVDMVVLGCPHVSVYQLQQIAGLLEGRRVKEGVLMEVLTSDAIKAVADRQGLTKTIEESGALLLSRTCPTCYPLGECMAASMGIRSMATDSSKMAHYAAADSGRIPVYYGTTEQVIDAAVSGIWTAAEE